ncbi:MAG: hypothetical protein ACI8W7_002198, partial [Gammaproteobacteria bacterium]
MRTEFQVVVEDECAALSASFKVNGQYSSVLSQRLWMTRAVAPRTLRILDTI